MLENLDVAFDLSMEVPQVQLGMIMVYEIVDEQQVHGVVGVLIFCGHFDVDSETISKKM